MEFLLMGVLLLILIVAPFMMRNKSKKEVEAMQTLIEKTQKGDKVLMSCGVFGKVVSFAEKDGFKTITVESGDEKNKGYVTFDANAIYMNISLNKRLEEEAEKEAAEAAAKLEADKIACEKAENKQETVEEAVVVEEQKTEVALEEKTEEPKKVVAKKTTSKTKKTTK